MNYSYGLLLLIYVSTALFSAVFVVVKLTHTNITPKIRTLIMRRHVIFIIFYVSVNIYVFWTFIYLLKYNNQINQKNTPTARFFKALYFLQGYFMPILRCLEPGFLDILRKNLMCSSFKEEQSMNQETSLAFLASKLNVELVNSILKGITRFALVDLDQSV